MMVEAGKLGKDKNLSVFGKGQYVITTPDMPK